MEYLYHGSDKKVSVLVPHQAKDECFEKGCQYAVYATSNKNMALAFALGGIPNNNGELVREMMPEYGDIMQFIKGYPNKGGKGYLYVLDKKDFKYEYGTQWVCYRAVTPLKVIEIDVDDYLYLCNVYEEG